MWEIHLQGHIPNTPVGKILQLNCQWHEHHYVSTSIEHLNMEYNGPTKTALEGSTTYDKTPLERFVYIA
jgi:hypothetical protein